MFPWSERNTDEETSAPPEFPPRGDNPLQTPLILDYVLIAEDWGAPASPTRFTIDTRHIISTSGRENEPPIYLVHRISTLD